MADLVTTTELARIVGVTRVTIGTWISEGCPIAERGSVGKKGHKFDTREVIEWRIKRERENANTNFGEQMSKDEASRRKTQAQAELAEVEVALKKGKVVELDEIEKKLSDEMAHLRAKMRKIPERVVMQVLGETDERKIKNTILNEIDEALEHLSYGE